MPTHEKLKQIRQEKRELLERQRELQAKADETKEERKAFRTQIAEARKDARTHKSTVRILAASINECFKNGDAEEILALADELSTATENLVLAIRSFGEATDELRKL